MELHSIFNSAREVALSPITGLAISSLGIGPGITNLLNHNASKTMKIISGIGLSLNMAVAGLSIASINNQLKNAQVSAPSTSTFSAPVFLDPPTASRPPPVYKLGIA